jgi:hypothetical protein
MWFFVGEVLSRLGLTTDEHDDLKDLCGLDRRSVIRYVHRRYEYCIARFGVVSSELAYGWTCSK